MNLRTDGGAVDGSDDALATLESASVRTYDSAREVPEWVSDGTTVATPGEFDLDLSVNVVTETATVREPARIAVRFEYHGDDPLPFTGNPRLGASRVPIYDSTDGLHLSPAVLPIEREDDRCWTVHPLGVGLSCLFSRFEPGEVSEEGFDIVADSNAGICYPRGEYEIVQRYNLSGEYEDVDVYWGLVLELS